MKCKDCKYDMCTLDGCMFSHDPNQEAREYFRPKEEEGKKCTISP